MPLVRVSKKTKKAIRKLKKDRKYQTEDLVVWNGVNNLSNKKARDKLVKPTLDFDLFKKQEDFSL